MPVSINPAKADPSGFAGFEREFPMSTEIDYAVKFYDKASEMEEQGQLELAELYFLKSACLFQQAGDVHFMDAANVLNAVGFLRESRGNYGGALYSAKQSAKIMETYSIEFSNREADEIR